MLRALRNELIRPWILGYKKHPILQADWHVPRRRCRAPSATGSRRSLHARCPPVLQHARRTALVAPRCSPRSLRRFARRHEQGDPPRFPGGRRRLRSGGRRTTCTPARSCRRSSRRCYTYDYLARPSKLVPLTAEALPQITDNGKTYTIRLRKGIYFTPDPAFKGQKRELVADDYVYSLKRLVDPKIRSPWALLVEGKIVGLDEARRRGEEVRQVRLRREGRGPRGDRPLHAADPAQGHRLQPAVRARARADVARSRAR